MTTSSNASDPSDTDRDGRPSGAPPSDGGTDLTFPLQHARTGRFTYGLPRNIAVAPDGASVLFLRSKGGQDSTLCLWVLDPASSTEHLLLDPSTLGSTDEELSAAELARRERARESAAGIVRYTTDRSFERAVMEVGGSIVLLELDSGEVRTFPAADGLFDARIDPTGCFCAYVANQTLRMIDLATGDDIELASDPDPLVSWGRAEFIAGEEMGRTRGFWWAPDGSGLLVTCVDDRLVDRWWIADPANPATPPTEIRYPAAGTRNAAVALCHIDRSGRRTDIEWATSGADTFEYLADVIWADDHVPLLVRQTRDQRIVSVAAIDVDDGSVSDRQRITDPTWVELIPGSPSWCRSGLLTVEDRADRDRRMLCLDGEPIDIGSRQVRTIVAVHEMNVILTVWTEPTQIHVVAVDLSGDEPTITPLTAEPGVHNAAAGNSTVVITSTSSATATPQITVNRESAAVASIGVRMDPPVIAADPKFLRLGDRELAAALFVPRDHDGAASLPVLLDPYGGPHAQRVLENHLGHLTSQWFADQGFAVLVVDNRGTPGRGPAFERAVWGDLAAPALEDQISALDAAGAEFAFLDLGRVGIRGWSFGGYLAALAALRAPERIHAAIAGAPVTDWRLYDTHYTERYLGHPAQHPGHYEQTDLTAEASSLTRPLLIVHGLADDNVVAAHSLQLSSALLAAGRPHSVLPLSGVTHMTPQEVVAENLLHLQRDFLQEHLGGPVAAS